MLYRINKDGGPVQQLLEAPTAQGGRCASPVATDEGVARSSASPMNFPPFPCAHPPYNQSVDKAGFRRRISPLQTPQGVRREGTAGASLSPPGAERAVASDAIIRLILGWSGSLARGFSSSEGHIRKGAVV